MDPQPNNQASQVSVDPVQFAQGLRQTYPGRFDAVKDDYALAHAWVQSNPQYGPYVNFGPVMAPNPAAETVDQNGTHTPPNPLAAIASLGKEAVGYIEGKTSQENQALAQAGHPILGAGLKAGTDTLAEALIPQNQTAVGLAGLNGLSALGNVGEEGENALSTALQRTAVPKPTGAQVPLGQALTAATGVPLKYMGAVLADPSILTDATPGTAEVGKMYTQAFKSAGLQVNSQTLDDMIGDPFPPRTDTEIGKLKNIVLTAKQTLDSGQPLDDSQAFLARSAASKLANAGPPGSQFNQVASGLKNVFDDQLENSSLPNIRDLSAKYFRANAKEAFDSWLPQNKNLSPNALRGLIMSGLGIRAGVKAVEGDYKGAVGSGLEAALMSPAVVGAGIGGVGALQQVLSNPMLGEGAKAALLIGANKALPQQQDQSNAQQ